MSSLDLLDLQTVLFVEADKNIVVCLRKIINDTVNVRFDILRTLNVYMMMCSNMQRVGYTKVVPEKLVQC